LIFGIIATLYIVSEQQARELRHLITTGHADRANIEHRRHAHRDNILGVIFANCRHLW